MSIENINHIKSEFAYFPGIHFYWALKPFCTRAELLGEFLYRLYVNHTLIFAKSNPFEVGSVLEFGLSTRKYVMNGPSGKIDFLSIIRKSCLNIKIRCSKHLKRTH